MTVDTWLLYVGTVLIFMSAPGPSHLLIVSTSMSNGFRRSFATIAGDLSANTVQILLAGFGLAAVISTSRYGFTIIKWAGVTYLIWLGIRHIVASYKAGTRSAESTTVSLGQLWLRGFVASAANPKAIVFFAALFPQFLNTTESLVPQIAILGATYIVFDGCFLTAYSKAASWIALKLESKHKAWIERGAGVSLIAAAVLLGLRSITQA